jgi:hypothetical protein
MFCPLSILLKLERSNPPVSMTKLASCPDSTCLMAEQSPSSNHRMRLSLRREEFPRQKDAHDRLPTDEKPFRKKSRTTSLRFLLPKLGLVLLVAVATATMAIQSAYGCDGNNGNGNGVAASAKKKPSGIAAITLLNEQATLTRFTLSNAPKDDPLIIHIHAANTESTLPADKCKGPVLFVLKNTPGGQELFKTDPNGQFSIKRQTFSLAPVTPGAPTPDLSQIDTWYVNVHDATKPLPIPTGSPPGTKPKFASIACGIIKVGANPTKGTAKLQAEAAAKPASNVVPALAQTAN